MTTGYPRYFNIAGAWINAYQVFLCVGIYVGSLTSAALAQQSGLSPLGVGVGAMTCALVGLIGARVYHVIINAHRYFPLRPGALWDSRSGGWGVFGALITFVPMSLVTAWTIGITPATFFDHAAGGVLAGGFWIRLGCVFNGCCAGRETNSAFAVRLHDTQLIRKRRIPVQFLEMGWWLLGSIAFLSVWPRPLPAGSYALGVLAWYGSGRFFLEPMQERKDVVFGRVPINQLVAAVLAIASVATLLVMQ